MGFRYLGDVATADAAFEAWGESVEEMFVAAAEATLGVMVENPDAIEGKEKISISLTGSGLELLLFDFLQELIFFKDARSLLLRIAAISIDPDAAPLTLFASARGEVVDPERHALITDVKAVTLYRFSVARDERGWKATVVLDV
jgi:SHS2 domain-containing protein